ncbi:MAG: transcriptional repressor [Meiothermus sp.]
MAIKRLTRQRKAVLEVVRTAKGHHPDAAWVYHEVRKLVPSISLGTVYRTLEALVEEGYLLPLTRSGDATRYEANLDGHLHMLCTHCGEYHDLHINLPDLLAQARAQYPYLELSGVQVEYEGVCERCRAEMKS